MRASLFSLCISFMGSTYLLSFQILVLLIVNPWPNALLLLDAFLPTLKTLNIQHRSSRHGTAETNLTRNHEVAGSVPCLIQCVKDLVLPWAVGWRCGSDPMLLWLWRRQAAIVLIGPPSLGTSICQECSPKKKKKKKKEKKSISNIGGPNLVIHVKHNYLDVPMTLQPQHASTVIIAFILCVSELLLLLFSPQPLAPFIQSEVWLILDSCLFPTPTISASSHDLLKMIVQPKQTNKQTKNTGAPIMAQLLANPNSIH